MSENNYSIWCKWKYFYKDLKKDWIDSNAFVLCANVETFQKANVWSWTTLGTKDTYEDVKALINMNDFLTSESSDAVDSVFCTLRP